MCNIYSDKLERLTMMDSKFKRSLSFIDYVRNSATSIYGHEWEKKIKYISEKLDDLIAKFGGIYKGE